MKMKNISNLICKHKIMIIIITLLLMIPSIIGYVVTDINYDILVYLPSDIETLKGEHILTDDFKMGAFSIVITENMSNKDVLKLEEEFRNIESVETVFSINDLTGTTIPVEMLPSEIVSRVVKENETLILVTFSNSTSDDLTLNAVSRMREIVDNNVKIGGMSTMVLDTKELFNSEMLLYVIIAAILCILVLELSLDSYLVPFLLMINIGIAILFNMGSNIIFGNISYITKAIAAVLQLGVTTDFSIFLYHKYEKLKNEYSDKNQAMSEAICDTFTSVFGSSLTTIAGFLALCTMKLTLGVDIGLVMAKGVLIGVICVLTIFPALLLVFDKQVEKTKHKEILPKFNIIKNFVLKHYKLIFILFLISLIPAYFAQNKTEVYYKLDESIPDNYGYSVATKKLKEDFGMVSQEMILIDVNKEDYIINQMIDEIKDLPGIDLVISPSSFTKYGLTDEMIPSKIRKLYETDKYKMIIVTSDYDIATDELNNQIDEVNKIIKKYDSNAIFAGEGPLMKDLVTTTDIDFNNVNYTSIGVIFILMMIVLKSISLPVLLVTAIEFAIFINMGVPYFTGTQIPFIASVVIGTIQLGATIDYAILMTTKYLEERKNGSDKKDAVKCALDNSVTSIFVSAMCFFGATIGVGIVSKIDMIGCLCTLIARGAIISMLVVILVVPSILLIFDKLIIKTTLLKKEGNNKMKKNKIKKVIATSLVLSFLFTPISTFALSKEETVYGKLNSDGSIKTLLVNEHLINDNNKDILEDLNDLENIININGDNTFSINNNLLTWNANGSDIFYQGTSKKDLPINLNITYKLDGKDITLDDLIGKKGSVEINIKYTNNSKNIVKVNGKNETLYTPFVVATVTNIPCNNNSNVNVTNGRVIDNGVGYSIIGLSSPGLYESLNIEELKNLDNITISFDTEKFELSSIYTVVTPKVIESSDLDFISKINTLYSSVDKLQTSINQIANGSSLISENMNTVLEKLEQIKNGAVSIDDGLKQILSELNNAKTTLENNSSTDELAKMKQLISVNTDTINKLKTSIDTVTTVYNKYHLDQVSYENMNTFVSSLGLPQEQITVVVSQLTSAKYNYENMLDTNNNLITLLTNNNTALTKSLETFESTSKQINTLITSLNKYLGQLETGASNLSDGTSKLKEGVSTLNSKMSELNDGINKFNEQGIKQLTSKAYSIKQTASKIDALVKLSENYSSFSLTNKDTKSSTKFILVVDGKSAPKEEKVVVKETKKQSFLDRVINLFK